MPPAEAKLLIRHCLEVGSVKLGFHYRKRLKDRHITHTAALSVLRNGRINKAPKCDIKTGDWKYLIEGREPGGEWLSIVFTFETRDDAFLITIIDDRGGW